LRGCEAVRRGGELWGLVRRKVAWGLVRRMVAWGLVRRKVAWGLVRRKVEGMACVRWPWGVSRIGRE
jgi:hypothetical protein